MTTAIGNTLVTIIPSNIPGEFKVTIEKGDGSTFTTEMNRADLKALATSIIEL